MTKYRSVATNINEDEWYGTLSFFEQKVWDGLMITMADDQGRLVDNAILIRNRCFPYKDIPIADVEAALSKFAGAGKVLRYAKDRKALIQLVRWWEHHVTMQWAQPSEYPAPDDWSDHVRYTFKGKHITVNWPVALAPSAAPEPPVQVSAPADQQEPPHLDMPPGHATWTCHVAPTDTDTDLDTDTDKDNSERETRARAAALPPSLQPTVTTDRRVTDQEFLEARPGLKAARNGDPPPMTASVKSVYHDELGIYLTGKPLLALAEAVTDLDKLREVCCAMAMRGIGKGNVECALEWYRDGIPYRGKEGKRDERVKVGQAGYRGNGGGSSRSRYRPDSEKQYGRWNDV